MATNAELTAHLYDCMNRGDIDSLLAGIDDTIEFRVAEHSPYWTPEPFQGPHAVLEGVFARMPEDYETFRIDPERIIESGDTVIAQVRYRGAGRVNGKTLDAEAVHIFDFRDGKVVRFRQYVDTWQTAEVTGMVAGRRMTTMA